MSSKSKDTAKTDANTKRSRWKFFPKDRRKSSEPGAPGLKPNENGVSSSDSTYGSNGENSANPSENEHSPNTSLRVPKEVPGRTPSPQNIEKPQTNGMTTMTSPTVHKETHINPATGTQVTTITTTTTTTTTITGPNGTTVIEEPRAELGDGRRTPEPSLSSEAVAAAINGQGNGDLHHRFGSGESQAVPGQWNQITPGRRPIPQKEGNVSMTDLRLSSATDDRPHSTFAPNGPAMLNLPPPGSNRYSIDTNAPSPITEGSQDYYGSNASTVGPQPSAYPTKRQSRNWAHIPEQIRPGSLLANPDNESTFTNLKRAAVGIHGAGETLRGTIAQTADRKLGAGKAAEQRMAKHQDIIDKGKYQMQHRKLIPQQSSMPSLQVGPQQAHYAQGIRDPSMQQHPQQGHYAQGMRDPPLQPHSRGMNTPQPDAHPTHIDVSQRRFSGSRNTRSPSPGDESTDGKGTFGRWLHKARSHPSDKKPKTDGTEDSNTTNTNDGKLKRRSKGRLGALAE